MESLVQLLAGALPLYRLPAATPAHSRHYMPGAGDKRTLLFDSWAAVDKDAELLVVWPEVSLPEAERALLERIVDGLGYLGRAEGWVEGRVGSPDDARSTRDELLADGGEAEVGPTLHGRWDAFPAARADEESLETTEVIRLPVPMAPAAYRHWREERVREEGLDKNRLSAKERRLLATLPTRLIDALRLESAEVRGAGWSSPPGCRFETYRRRADAFEPKGVGRSATGAPSALDPPTTVRFALGGRPLPRIEDAVRVGEVLRVALMANTDRRSRTTAGPPGGGGEPDASPGRFAGRAPAIRRALELLSGHGLPAGADHAFFLPEDADGDGHIDHILLHLPGGLTPPILRGVAHTRQIWREADERWPALAEAMGRPENFGQHPYVAPSRVWESVTPYLHPWFRKKGFGIREQILKECGLRGWGQPELEFLVSVRVGSKQRRPIHFHRFRSRRGLTQPDRSGSLWRLTFREPVSGPVTLGFGRHFGLGMFRGSSAD